MAIQGLVVRKVNHVLKLHEVAASESKTLKRSFAKRDMFSTQKIIDHLVLHLDSDSSGGIGEGHQQGVSLYVDDHSKPTSLISTVPGACAASTVQQPEKTVNALVRSLPTSLTTLLTRETDSSLSLCAVAVKAVARKLFYAGQVCV